MISRALRRGVKQWAAGVAILLILSVGLGFWLLRGQRKTAQEIGEAKQSLAAMNVEMTKLRQGIMEYPRIEAKARDPPLNRGCHRRHRKEFTLN